MATANPIFTEEELQQELWADVPEWEGVYQVSTLGRIKKLTHTNSIGKNRVFAPNLHKGERYIGVNLFHKGRKSVRRNVHVLVAAAFLGPRPKGMHVNHKGSDGDRSNNRLSNLEYTTPQGNVLHAIASGLHDPRKCAAKLTPEQVQHIRRPSTQIPQLARELGLDKSTLYNARKRKSFSHIP